MLFILLLPFYKQVFDVDGIGYSLVAQHLAHGNFARAINGFWSPLHSWLIAPFIKTGIPVELLFFLFQCCYFIGVIMAIEKVLPAFSIYG